ncbi:MAG: TonB-dependent receptor, partial [Myxococcota bacterium]
MRRVKTHPLLIIVAVIALPRGVLSDPEPPESAPVASQADAPATFEAVVTTTRINDGLDAQRRLDETSHGFATAIEVEHAAVGRPADALPEIIARAPGAVVRSIGGLGQFSSVSLRGSSGQQVAVFLDGVPLENSMAGMVDLANVSLEALRVIEIYRGYVPVQFGGATIGGAINLVGKVHRGPAHVQLDGGLGSFGAREARLVIALPVGERSSVVARVGYAGSLGNFPFYHDGKTPLIDSDDGTELRKNNGYDRLLGQLRLDGRHGQWRYGVQQLALWKPQGLPGSYRAQTVDTGLQTLDMRTTGSLGRTGVLLPAGRLTVVGGLGLQRVRFRNPTGAIPGQAHDQVALSTDVSFAPRLRIPTWTGAFVTATASARYEWVDIEERSDIPSTAEKPSGDATRRRTRAGVGIQLEQYLVDHRIVVAPIVRIDVVDSRFRVPPGEGEQQDVGEDTRVIGVSPRLGLRARLLDWLELRGSFGRYFRPPSLLELFGDRGPIRGNEGLKPEKGTAVDFGLVSDILPAGPFGLYLQAASFVTWSEDLIDWSMAGKYIRFDNLAKARVAGFELGASGHGWGDRLELQAAYTYLHSRNYSRKQEAYGKQLLGRPQHDL